MNENINLCEILKDCTFGTKLYSPLYGNVTLFRLDLNSNTVTVKLVNDTLAVFKDNGYLKFIECNRAERRAEIMLYPSIDQRDWSKWKCPKPKKPKFDPKTLQPFDKVLTRVSDNGNYLWFADFVSAPASNDMPTIVVGEYRCDMVIPYNDDTKHLVGTTDEAPEYYRYWEE